MKDSVQQHTKFPSLPPVRCYAAEDLATRLLVGYVLFFNTLDERATKRSGERKGASCHTTDDPVAVIEDLYVEPDYRGKGIATQLFRKVLQVSIGELRELPLLSLCLFHLAASDIFNGPLIMTSFLLRSHLYKYVAWLVEPLKK